MSETPPQGSLAQGKSVAPRIFGPLTLARVQAYGEASLDMNPLHFDPEIAARAGLLRPPVHGMLIVGFFERYLADWRPGARIVKLSAKFIRPVLLGDSIEMTGKVVRAAEGQPAVLRLTVKAVESGDITCLAEVFLHP